MAEQNPGQLDEPIGGQAPAPALDYAGPGTEARPPRSANRDLFYALAEQFFAFCMASAVLDMGEVFSATFYLSGAYWLGVLAVLMRRHGRLSRADHFFIRFGLIFILVVGVPVFISVWRAKGVM